MFKFVNPFCSPGSIERKQPSGFPYQSDWESKKFWTLCSEDRKLLYVNYFVSPNFKALQKARVLVISHGHSEQWQRYRHFPFYLKDLVDVVVVSDHRGHGMSEGIRGHSRKFELFANDLAKVVEAIPKMLDKESSELELHFLGHSMGGLIGLDLLTRHNHLNFKSATINAPMIELAFQVPKYKEVLGKVLLRVAPWLPVPAENTTKFISKDQNVVTEQSENPYNHGLLSPATYYGYLDLKSHFLEQSLSLSTPLLLQVPLEDRIIDPSTTISKLYPNIVSPNKQIRLYEKLYHESYNESSKERVFQDLKDWILTNSSL